MQPETPVKEPETSMAIYRVSIAFQFDSAFPRDAVTINPHYQGDNASALADALKTNIKAAPGVPLMPFTIKVYDAEKAPPSYPLYTTTEGTGFLGTTVPRELALCLSYYSAMNRPTYRGRLFIPACLCTGTCSIRPTAGQITAALGWKTILTQNLPASHTWSVYSQVRKQANTVTHAWVDNEWDVQRSRGLRGETRQLSAVP